MPGEQPSEISAFKENNATDIFTNQQNDSTNGGDTRASSNPHDTRSKSSVKKDRSPSHEASSGIRKSTRLAEKYSTRKSTKPPKFTGPKKVRTGLKTRTLKRPWSISGGSNIVGSGAPFEDHSDVVETPFSSPEEPLKAAIPTTPQHKMPSSAKSASSETPCLTPKKQIPFKKSKAIMRVYLDESQDCRRIPFNECHSVSDFFNRIATTCGVAQHQIARATVILDTVEGKLREVLLPGVVMDFKTLIWQLEDTTLLGPESGRCWLDVHVQTKLHGSTATT